MSTTKKQLSMIPINKTVIICSPIQNKDETLTRTGSIGDGSCLFHSLLHAFSKTYVDSSIEERKKIVAKLRQSIAKRLTIQDWEKLNGDIALILFQSNVLTILTDFYSLTNTPFIKKLKDIYPKMDEIINVIKNVLNITHFEKFILPNAYKNINSLNNCKTNISKETLTFFKNIEDIQNVNPDAVERLSTFLNNITTLISEEAEKSAYNTYIKKLEDPSEDIDMFMLGMISDHFNRDIYVIHAETRLPYRDNMNLKERKSIIILWVGGNHYEIMGRLDKESNKIQREFDHDEEIIQKMYTLLKNPEDIGDKFPELEQYVPISVKKKKREDMKLNLQNRMGRNFEKQEQDFCKSPNLKKILR